MQSEIVQLLMTIYILNYHIPNSKVLERTHKVEIFSD
jgi:hypothetical protein